MKSAGGFKFVYVKQHLIYKKMFGQSDMGCQTVFYHKNQLDEICGK